MHHRSMLRLVLGLVAVLAAAFAASAASASSGKAKPDVQAEFTTQGSVASQFLQNATTIPH